MNLKSGDVELRVLRESDALRLVELADNEKISENLRDAFPHPFTLQDAEKFIHKAMKQEVPTSFAIEYKGEYVGNIGLKIGEDVHRKTAEIGYFIGESYWNKGIATIALQMITDYGFRELDIVRIHTGIFEFNIASQRVMEKCGFNIDGIFKKSIFKKDRIWDEIRYSKINPVYAKEERGKL
jgi:ribosomal-protein-alanine N-acetyltransferase